jgi:hypothetical protein
VLDHQRDLWADFRAFYGLSPAQALALPGPEYMALAWRAPAYAGVMAARLASQEEDRPASSVGAPAGATVRDLELGAAGSLGADSDGLALGDLFDVG